MTPGTSLQGQQWGEGLWAVWDAVHGPMEQSLHHSPGSWDLRLQHPAGNVSLLRQKDTAGSSD